MRQTLLQPAGLLFILACATMFVMPLGTSPFTILGFCMLAVWIFSGEFLRSKEIFLRQPWFLPVLLIAALAWLGLLWSADPKFGLKYASKSYYWLYALVIASVVPLSARKERLIGAFLAGLLVNAAVAFFQLAEILPRFSRWGAKGYSGFYGGYNTLGILLVLGILLASFYLRAEIKKKWKMIAGFLCVVYFGHLMILESRGGYFTFLVLSPLLFLNVLGRRRRYLIIPAYLVAAAVLYSSPIVRNRVHSAVSDMQYHLNNKDDSWGKRYSDRLDRMYMWRWAAVLFEQHPLLGVGTGGYRQAVLSAGGDAAIDHPHSNFLYMAASFGVCGIFLLAWLFWILLKSGWKNRTDPIGFFVLAASLVILFGGLSDTQILDSGGAFLMALTTGLQTALNEKRRPAQKPFAAAPELRPRLSRLPFRILHRYLFFEIWPTLVASLLVFIFIVLAAKMLNISEWVVNHGVRLADVGRMIFYLLPGMVLFALPAAILMAVFISFLRLSNDNEIMAVKSSGISMFQLLPPVFTISIVCFVAALSISILVVPWGNRSFRDLIFRIAKTKAEIGIKERVFSEPFDKVTFYVNSFSPKDKVMKDLFLVDRRDPSMTNTIVAKTGRIVSDPEGRAIIIQLKDGTAFTVEKKEQAARTVQFSSYNLKIGLDDIMPPDALRNRSPKEMSVQELFANLRNPAGKKAGYYQMAVELMERFSLPVAVFLMGLIGAPLGAQIRSRGRSLGISVSMGVFIVYYLILAGVRSIGETGTLSPFLGMWLPPAFLLVSSIFLLKRVQQEKQLLEWGRQA